MIAHRFLPIAFILCLFAPHRAFALDWEIERNFRYFLYPSDVAVQRVARDLYIAQKGATPTPEQLEEVMNGSGFWTMKLGQAGDLRKRWPIDWPRDDSATPYELIAQMRAREGRPPLVPEQELDRRGWASLLVRERTPSHRRDATLTGSTETCWNPVQKLHSGCAVWAIMCGRPDGSCAFLIPKRPPVSRVSGTSRARSLLTLTHSNSSPRRNARFRQGRQVSRAIVESCASSSLPTPAIPRLSPAR
jgi:hypothetical protein